MPFYVIAVLLLVIFDQLFKLWVANTIVLNHSLTVLPGIMSLTNLRNNGAAWSILEGQHWFFVVISIGALGLILYYLWRFRRQPRFAWPLVLMFSGTVGNFMDRLRLGYVVDMFQVDFFNFPIFNIADMCLSLGVFALIITILLEKEEPQ